MPLYAYKGRAASGKVVTGKQTADSEQDLLNELTSKGTVVTAIKPLTGILYKEIHLFKKGVKIREFTIYLRQFATLLKAGITIIDATIILQKQTASKPLKVALNAVIKGLQEGKPLSSLAAKHPEVFPPLFVNMMEAGEVGGNLDDILERLAIFFEKRYNTQQKVKSALAYPLAITVMSLFSVIFLLVGVVPTFVSMFKTFNAKLPLLTTLVIKASQWLGSYWWLLVLGALIMIITVFFLDKKVKLRPYIDWISLKIPLFGPFMQKAVLANMTRTLSSLFSSGVPVLQALDITEKVVGNHVIATVLREARGNLARGESMVRSMEHHWAFPPLVTQMVAVGEKTGAIDVMLEKVADFYEAEVDIATDQVKALIEPLTIMILSVIVGVIVLAIALPMFSLFNQIQ